MKKQPSKHLILAFLLIGLFFLFFLSPTDPDLGWQLRCGQQIWEQKKICSHNEFSVLLENYYWPDARALYQIIIFFFYKFFGLFGLSFINSLLMLASFIFFLSLSGKKELKIILFPLIIFLSWTVLGFGIRNQLFTLFFFFCLLKLIELADQKKIKWFLFSPLVMFLWANSHGGFILGVILLLVFLLEKTIQLITSHQEIRSYLSMLGLVSLSIGVTFLNPFGYQVYLEAWRHFSIVPLSQLIAEWVPPSFWLQFFVVLLLTTGLGILYQARKQSLTIFKTFIIVALAFLALKARRDLALFFLFSGYTISSFKMKTKNLQPWVLLASMALFFFGLFIQLPRTIITNSSWPQFCASGSVSYAYQAVKFLKEQPEKGNIFNTYEQGGFLVWQLPEYKIFVDGRMPAWKTPSGKSPYTIYLETLQTQPGWQKILEDYKIDWLFIGPGTFMDLKIRNNPQFFGWQEVYRDKITVIYKKI